MPTVLIVFQNRPNITLCAFPWRPVALLSVSSSRCFCYCPPVYILDFSMSSVLLWPTVGNHSHHRTALLAGIHGQGCEGFWKTLRNICGHIFLCYNCIQRITNPTYLDGYYRALHYLLFFSWNSSITSSQINWTNDLRLCTLTNMLLGFIEWDGTLLFFLR